MWPETAQHLAKADLQLTQIFVTASNSLASPLASPLTASEVYRFDYAESTAKYQHRIRRMHSHLSGLTWMKRMPGSHTSVCSSAFDLGLEGSKKSFLVRFAGSRAQSKGRWRKPCPALKSLRGKMFTSRSLVAVNAETVPKTAPPY